MRDSHRLPRKFRLALACLLLPALLAGGTALPRHAEPHLLAEWAGWVPGSTVTLGVHFVIEDGWHLYWKGQNDSGLPVQVTVELPAGFVAGELQWPAPERKVWPESTGVDHVYQHEVTLLLPVTVPGDAPAGSEHSARVRLQWLVCSDDGCVPEEAEATLSLPVLAPGGEAERGPGARRIEAARKRLPVPAPEDLSIRWDDEAVRLRAQGAAGLAFFPAEGGMAFRDLAVRGAASGEELALVRDPTFPGAGRLLGVLEVQRADGRREYWSVDAPGP